jgi:4-alpha-glucanotransferase
VSSTPGVDGVAGAAATPRSAGTGEGCREHGRALAIEQVLQFAFAQWNQLREAAAENAIRILGDVAIFVNMDSADVWVHPEIFELDEDLKPIRIAGVPPDYFSPTGQRWGNPLYRWDVLAAPDANGLRFDWWIDRIRRAVELYDIVRLDHFRGFEAYWAIPAEEETAINGEWVKAPGLELFRALEAALGPLPLVAEDLGLITPEVEALRKELGMPGMKVLQFGFSNKGAHTHLPQQFTPARWPTPARTTTTPRRAGGNRRAKRSVRPSRRSWARGQPARVAADSRCRGSVAKWRSFPRRICWSWARRRA